MKQMTKNDLVELNTRFEQRKNEIISSPNTFVGRASGKTFYVSPTGNDENDGSSPERAWRTIERTNTAEEISFGDTVLFERGGVWSRQATLVLREGVTYSAFGEGEKPTLSCYIAADNESDWTEVAKNVWVYSGEYTTHEKFLADYPDNKEIAGSYLVSSTIPAKYNCDDIGNIVLTKGRQLGWAAKITLHREDTDLAGLSVDIGSVTLGDLGTLTYNSKKFTSFEDMCDDFTFWHDNKNSRLYLCCSLGNPALYFDSIKLVPHACLASMKSHSTIDNFNLEYAGAFAISTGALIGATVQNCNIGFIGGSIQSYSFGGRTHPTRYGNAIQNWGACDGVCIKNNYIHDVYDAATTFQDSHAGFKEECIANDFHVTDNVFERNIYDVEIFLHRIPLEFFERGTHGYKNIRINGNLMRDAGRGFGDTRFDKAGKVIRVIDPVTLGGCEMKNNVIWGAANITLGAHFFNTDKGCVFDNNIVVCKKDTVFAECWDYAQGIEKYDTRGTKYSYTSENIQALIENKTFGENNRFMFTIDK